MRRSFILTLVFVAAIVMVSAVVALAKTPAAPAAPARVRVVHAVTDAPNVDVLVNGTPVFTDAGYAAVTNYADLAGGTYTVTLRPAGGGPTVFTQTLTVTDDTDYTVAAAGTFTTTDMIPFELLVYTDDNTLPARGNSRVRLLHLAVDAPAVDLISYGPGGTPIVPLFTNVPYKGVGDYINIPAGKYDLEVRVAGGATVLLPVVVDVPLDQGRSVYTVIVVGRTTGPGSAITPFTGLLTVDISLWETLLPLVVENFPTP